MSVPRLRLGGGDDDKSQQWYLHTPAEKASREEPGVGYPPVSNIQGLGRFDAPPAEGEPREGPRTVPLARAEESDYTRLARQRGQHDLLEFHPDMYVEKRRRPPPSYERNEWFYTEDNREADNQKRVAEQPQRWEFMKPEFLVHTPHQAPGQPVGACSTDLGPGLDAPPTTSMARPDDGPAHNTHVAESRGPAHALTDKVTSVRPAASDEPTERHPRPGALHRAARHHDQPATSGGGSGNSSYSARRRKSFTAGSEEQQGGETSMTTLLGYGYS